MTPYIEHLGPHFTKFFIGPNVALHYLTASDEGDFHDHPFDMEIKILHGSYTEEVMQPHWTDSMMVKHYVGDEFTIKADHIHRIVSLSIGLSITMASYGPWQRKSRFWRFGDKIERREFDGNWEIVT